MLDRFDIQIELPSLTYDEISGQTTPAETSAEVRERVIAARARAAGVDALGDRFHSLQAFPRELAAFSAS